MLFWFKSTLPSETSGTASCSTTGKCCVSFSTNTRLLNHIQSPWLTPFYGKDGSWSLLVLSLLPLLPEAEDFALETSSRARFDWTSAMVGMPGGPMFWLDLSRKRFLGPSSCNSSNSQGSSWALMDSCTASFVFHAVFPASSSVHAPWCDRNAHSKCFVFTSTILNVSFVYGTMHKRCW